jgi:hypothetical protein
MSLLVSSAFARDLLRLLAGWLACIVFVQAMASAVGLAQGPRHVHVRSEAAAPAVFLHAAGHAHDADHHEHGGWARHVHLSPTPDATLGNDAQDLGAAAGLVLAAMVALGPVQADWRMAEACHVMRALPAWSCMSHVVPLPERPPRA